MIRSYRPWLILLLGIGAAFGSARPSRSAEPLMDGSMFNSSRGSAPNQVQDGHFEDAIRSEEKALKINIDQYGPLHPSQVPILNDLGTLDRYLARYNDAELNYKWGLALREKAFGLDHPEVADSLGYLASLYVDLGRYEEASLLYQRALSIQKKAFGEKSLAVAQTLGEMGGLEIQRGNPGAALSDLQPSLALEEKEWGTDDLRLIPLLESMARASMDQKDFPAAEKLLQRALALREKKLQADDVLIAASEEKLADLYQTMGRPEDSKAFYEKAAKIRDRTIGPELYVNLPYLHGAALTDLALGRLKEAEKLLMTVLRITQTAYGKNNPQVAFELEEWAEIEKAKGEKEKAKTKLKEALAILEPVLAPGHPAIQKIQKKLDALSQ